MAESERESGAENAGDEAAKTDTKGPEASARGSKPGAAPDTNEPAREVSERDSSEGDGDAGTGDEGASDPGDSAATAGPAVVAPRPDARRIAALVFAVCFAVYALFAGDRLLAHSPDNHFAYLADSYLHGQLSVRCPPDEVSRHVCPPGGGGNDWARYNDRWFVAFPSFPAVVYMPAVALFGRDFRNRAYDVALAALAPALLYALLEKLVRKGRSARTWRENLAFTALFAFGTVFFFSAVQGSVWFTAHVVSASLMVGYLWFALDLENPALAGLLLAAGIHTRASLVYAAPWFALEALRVARKKGALEDDPEKSLAERAKRYLEGVDWARAIRAVGLFAGVVALGVALNLYLNKLRFDDPFEVGYRYLQIGWRGRIERWGLFNYHYLSRNLAIALGSLPWITRDFPYVVISLHGVALWVTTPHYLELARLRRRPGDVYLPFLAASAAAVALVSLLYQNSGWVQFGYRFSNDYAVLLVVLLALYGRRVNKSWLVLLGVAILVNAFGAATFDRTFPRQGAAAVSFYDNDRSQQRYFQPD